MANGTGGIRAGRAFVELFAEDSKLKKGLAAASARVKAWGATVSKMGSAVMAAGAIDLTRGLFGVGALGLASKAFADAGSQLFDMSQKTGLAVEELSGLSFAAEQSGVSVETLEGALLKMQKGGFGSGLADLEKYADELANLKNPAARTQRAMELFGKSGAQLLPMLNGGAAGLRDFKEQAERLGIVMSGTDAEAADELGDRFDQLRAQMKSLWRMVGAAVAPALTDLFREMQPVLREGIEWVKANRELIVVLGKLALASVAVGAAEFAFGGALKVVGIALSASVSVAGLLVAGLTALLSPLGLVTAALVAGGAAWLHFTAEGNAALDSLKASWSGLQGVAMEAWGGIVDALRAGDIALAGKIAMKGLEVAFNMLTAGLSKTWTEFTGWFQKVWGEITNNLAKGFIVLGGQAEKALLAFKLAATGQHLGGAELLRRQIEGQKAIDEETRQRINAADAGLAENNKAIDALKAADFKAMDQEIAGLVNDLDNLRRQAAFKAAVAPDFGGQDIGAAMREAMAGVEAGQNRLGGGAAGTFDPNALRGLGGNTPFAEFILGQNKLIRIQKDALDELRNGGIAVT